VYPRLNDRPDPLSEDVHLVETIKRLLIGGASLAAVVIYILKSA
jgi:hypothetical protein